jgi:hypothetical protein
VISHLVQCVYSWTTSLPRAISSARATSQWVMRMSRHLAPLVFALGASTVAPVAQAETPTTSPTSTASYDADLRTYLNSIHWYEHALARVPHLDDPFNREFFTAFAAASTPDEFYAKAMPIFESYISPKDARTLALMAQRRPVAPADQQTALEAFSMIDQHAKPKLRHVWDALMDAFSQHSFERALTEVRHSIADMVAHNEPNYVPSVGKVGLSFLDQIDALIVKLYAQQWNASKLKESRCSEPGVAAVLAPASLLTNGGFVSAHVALDECQLALQTQEASNEAAFKEFTTRAKAIPLTDRSSLLKQIERASLEVHERAQKLGRLHRQFLEDQTRLVSAIEVRREHIHLEDGQLAFDSDDDAVQVNHIVDDIVTHGDAINDFLRQVRQDSPLLRGIDFRDGATTDEKAAADSQ